MEYETKEALQTAVEKFAFDLVAALNERGDGATYVADVRQVESRFERGSFYLQSGAPNGLRLHVWGGFADDRKAEISVAWPLDNGRALWPDVWLPNGVRAPRISVSVDRPAGALAADITRRMIIPAGPLWASMLEKKARIDQERTDLAAATQRIAALVPGANVEGPGKIRRYRSPGGLLEIELTSEGGNFSFKWITRQPGARGSRALAGMRGGLLFLGDLVSLRRRRRLRVRDHGKGLFMNAPDSRASRRRRVDFGVSSHGAWTRVRAYTAKARRHFKADSSVDWTEHAHAFLDLADAAGFKIGGRVYR